MSGFKFKQLNYLKAGSDEMEVRLRDSSFDTYFRAKVEIANKKQMKKLMDDLRAKGVNFPVR